MQVFKRKNLCSLWDNSMSVNKKTFFRLRNANAIEKNSHFFGKIYQNRRAFVKFNVV